MENEALHDEKMLPVGEPTIVAEPAPVVPEPQVVIHEKPLPGVPSPKAQQWGVLISIVIIVLMVIVGAVYAWGKRIAQDQQLIAPAAVQ